MNPLQEKILNGYFGGDIAQRAQGLFNTGIVSSASDIAHLEGFCDVAEYLAGMQTNLKLNMVRDGLRNQSLLFIEGYIFGLRHHSSPYRKRINNALAKKAKNVLEQRANYK